ncbi:MAG: MscL family protein [Bacilli bacterium]|nr:MscL family protein [Bacilli bacterium]
MAVGVIIGGAFGTIVTAVVNILLSLCTWGVPGGLKGLITVLPAANATQAGVSNIGQSFASSDLTDMTIRYAANSGADITADSATFVQWQTSLKTLYTLHGGTYVYNLSASIDWGAFINAVISFLIIALVLFVVVKTIAKVKEGRKALAEEAKEKYYQLYPEERPAPAVPGVPAPTEMEILIQIRDELKKQNAANPPKKQ